MIRALLLATLAIATPVAAAQVDRLQEAVKGRVALPPKRCIFPDWSVAPQIIEGQAIIYHDSRYAYVGRFKGGCPALREGRRIQTIGRLCENEPARITETTGTDFGFCTFDMFTPYKKVR